MYTRKTILVTTWHYHIGVLINKKEKLNKEEEKEIRKMNRFHLERFHFFRHERKKNYSIDSIDYSRYSFEDLLIECCKEKL